MKALLCGSCGDIQALQKEWRSCRCGIVSAHWTNGALGLAEFRVDPDLRRYAFVLGLNNRLFGPALRGELGMFEDFRAAHELATDAPNHVFDKSRCGCWAVVFAVGRTNDVSWAD